MTNARDDFSKTLSSVNDAEPASAGVSLEVLCRRAERLIDTVRMMGEQVDRMFARPDRAVAEANEAGRNLMQLQEQVEAKIAEARRAEESCNARIEEFQKVLPTVQQSAEGLIQRVTRARELSEAFGSLMDAAADKINALTSGAGEVRNAREAVAVAVEELSRVQKTADNWADSVRQLSSKQAEFIAAGNVTASRLRTLSDAGERLRESVRQDIVGLRELLRESRMERLAWEQLLARMPATATPEGAKPGRSVPAALAERVRRLTDCIRQASDAPSETAAPAPARLAGSEAVVAGSS
jgi:chromosome segregation ATPase